MLNDPVSDRLVQLGMLKDRDFVAAIVGEQGLFASTWIADADATEALLAAL
jgi:hypothetical protein